MSEEFQASPEMQKFFVKLLDLKKYCKEEATFHEVACEVYMDIYKKLDEIIKEKE